MCTFWTIRAKCLEAGLFVARLRQAHSSSMENLLGLDSSLPHMEAVMVLKQYGFTEVCLTLGGQIT